MATPGLSRPGTGTAAEQQQQQLQVRDQQERAKEVLEQGTQSIPEQQNSGTSSVRQEGQPKSVPLSLSIVRVGLMMLFALIPILAVKRELNTGLLVLAVVAGVASIVSWSIVSWPKLSSQI